jgi:hypothetical protein
VFISSISVPERCLTLLAPVVLKISAYDFTIANDIALTINQEGNGQGVQNPFPDRQRLLILTVQGCLNGLRVNEKEEQPGSNGEQL